MLFSTQGQVEVENDFELIFVMLGGTISIVIAIKSHTINGRNLVFARIWIINFHFQRFYILDLDKRNTKNYSVSRHTVPSNAF